MSSDSPSDSPQTITYDDPPRTPNEPVMHNAWYYQSQGANYKLSKDPIVNVMYPGGCPLTDTRDLLADDDVQNLPFGARFYVPPPVGKPFMDPYGVLSPAAMVPHRELEALMDRAPRKIL
ncbi:MAG: uncharacterized protein KVP18_001254 [Porospora cf. gigantea A]|uniref:uncharacterized protein n=1 Tax=Porospora cf. gigantea A TaxID=2853593 RepID=UPI00355959FB|nr:MAG: hypothetical protein KVP18_001254 [Porospora cf. gigantea A]